MSLLTVSRLIFTSVGGPPALMPIGPRGSFDYVTIRGHGLTI